MGTRTTISVSEELADDLHGLKDRGDTYEDVIRRLMNESDDSAFARRLSRKSIVEQYGDDYYGENPGWASELEDLGENA